MKTIEDYELNNKKVLIRADFNVPIKDGVIIDDTRIKESLKTIRYVLEHGGKVILLSHLGRIKDEKDLANNSLRPVAKHLANLLNHEVIFIAKTKGDEVNATIDKAPNNSVILLENTRFEDLDGNKESNNDYSLGSYWASLGDIFINDAFGTLHRSHSSNVGIAAHLPNGIGFLVQKELQELNILNNPSHPYIVMLGGSKVKDKINVIKNLVTKADKIIIGGGMAYTFLKSQNFEIGTSLLDIESLEFCREIIKDYPDKIILPVDIIASDSIESLNKEIYAVNAMPNNKTGLDIGPKTIELYKKTLNDAKTIFWNGPFGVYEKELFANGTKEILNAVVSSNAITILGGGDIVAAANKFGLKDKIQHASTGGGASLEYIEGRVLPGLDCINN